MRYIVLIGPDGAGKGTQAELLALRLRVPHISLGSVLRAEVRQGTPLGKSVEASMAAGQSVPDEIVNRLVAQELSRPTAQNGAILDGYPRTLPQADEFENIMKSVSRPITDVVLVDTPVEECMRRIAGRRICSAPTCSANYHTEFHPPRVKDVCDRCNAPLVMREDDAPDVVRAKHAVYESDTVPLIELYRAQGLLRRIPGGGTMSEVQRWILAALRVEE